MCHSKESNTAQIIENLSKPVELLDIVEDLEFLRQKSGHVFSEELTEKIVHALREKTESFHGGCVGLSAVQIGIPLRIGYLKIHNKEIVMVNPEIIERRDRLVFGREGCMSFPGDRVDTLRYNMVVVRDDYNKETMAFSGLKAQAVQHEIDHMDGITFHDRKAKADDRKTMHRNTPRVGRNKPCPCGSGKKNKKCCGV